MLLCILQTAVLNKYSFENARAGGGGDVHIAFVHRGCQNQQQHKKDSSFGLFLLKQYVI